MGIFGAFCSFPWKKVQNISSSPFQDEQGLCSAEAMVDCKEIRFGLAWVFMLSLAAGAGAFPAISNNSPCGNIWPW